MERKILLLFYYPCLLVIIRIVQILLYLVLKYRKGSHAGSGVRNQVILMEKRIKIYDLHDSQQYEDEKQYWAKKTPEEKLHALEVIRKTGYKLLSNSENFDGNQQRLRRVLRVVK